MLPSGNSEKLTSLDRSRAKRVLPHWVGSIAPARLQKTVLEICLMSALNLVGQTAHLGSCLIQFRFRYLMWLELQIWLQRSSSSFSAKVGIYSRVRSSQIWQAEVKEFSYPSKPWKQSNRGKIRSCGAFSSRKLAIFNLRIWQMIQVSSLPMMTPNAGVRVFSSPISSSSSFTIFSSSCFYLSVRSQLQSIRTSSSLPMAGSKGCASQSEASLNPSLLSKGSLIVYSKYLTVAFLRISTFYWQMTQSKLQSVEPRGQAQTSHIADWQVFFGLSEIAVHWLRHLRFWQGSSSICYTNYTSSSDIAALIKISKQKIIYNSQSNQATNSHRWKVMNQIVIITNVHCLEWSLQRRNRCWIG